jgi:hypothetical protein
MARTSPRTGGAPKLVRSFSPEVLHGDAPAAQPPRLRVTKVASIQRAS